MVDLKINFLPLKRGGGELIIEGGFFEGGLLNRGFTVFSF